MKIMKLMTKAIEKSLPPLYANDGKKPEDVKVCMKIFNPYGAGTWYITEYDGKDLMFGLCCIHEAELGYVSLNELKNLRIGKYRLPLERDMYWKGTLADAYREENAKR